jgi:hypothetical protein
VSLFWTIFAGVCVFVGGQAAKSLLLDPALEMRKVLGEVDYSMFYLAHYYANPLTYEARERLRDEQQMKWDSVGDTLRQLAPRRRAASSRSPAPIGA